MTKKRYKLKIVALLILIVFVASFFVGCNLITINNKQDMQQVVADINLQQDNAALQDAFTTMQVQNFDASRVSAAQLQNTTIIKRDLMSAYLSYGYQQVGSMQIEEVFNNIMKTLSENRLNLQLAMLYYLYQGEVVVDSVVYSVLGDAGYTTGQAGTQVKMQKNALNDVVFSVENFNNRINTVTNTDANRQKLERVAAAYAFFLTENEQNYILNTVNSSINDAIDKYEKVILKLPTNSSEDSRTTPTGANQTNLYNLNKQSVEGVYTGYEKTDVPGYTKLPGSTTVTRTRAFTQFISSLVNNGLIERGENYSNISSLNYYLIECITQYESLLTTKFSATIATLPIDIKAGVKQEYDRLKGLQQAMGEKDFISTMDSLTDTTAIVATPKGVFGYVYNLLIPFDTTDDMSLKGEENKTSPAYYQKRNSLAAGIVATDQRAPWITGGTNYSFNANTVKGSYAQKMAANAATKNYFVSSSVAANATNYLFFDENFGQFGRAEGLTRYAGLYAFNGTVVSQTDGSYLVHATPVKIEDFIKNEFEGYLKYILGNNAITSSTFNWNKSYTAQDNYDFAIVYESKINSLDKKYYPGVSSVNTQYGTNYRALSAINELIFAYSTDTGSLNKPYGYGIGEKVDSDYVPEFKYAGEQLLKKDEGSYLAVVTDFGVHIMYLARKFNSSSAASVVEQYNENQIGDEGTFSNFFYNATVNSVIGTFTSNIRTQYLGKINTSKTVKLYKERYKDLYNG